MSVTLLKPDFWVGKRVFLTGHTGFKGGWLSILLNSLGAKICGYSLPPKNERNLYSVLNIASLCEYSFIDDIRDLERLRLAISESKPEIVVHMAAQPLVRYSYNNPIETYTTNVMGTANLLEAIRFVDSIRSVVIVTSDKCYENRSLKRGYIESDPMGGFDPYSSSKGCAELVTSAYQQSFFPMGSGRAAIATARAGNVIGGGDWSEDRLVPDALSAFEKNKLLHIRNPDAIRPWQHVLEPLSGYLMLSEVLYRFGDKFNGSWNFGPSDADARPVKDLIQMLAIQWGDKARWVMNPDNQFHEAANLTLDCSKAKLELGWTPKWSLEDAILKIIEWHKKFTSKEDMLQLTKKQINEFFSS